MSSLNKLKTTPITTHGGGIAIRLSNLQELRRSVLACLLWENQFYENGEDIAARILRLADKVTKEELTNLAIEAREVFKLRHVTLLLLCALIKRKGEGVADTIGRVIKRPDEMGELLAIYQKLGNKNIAKQLQKGLAKAFIKFDEYQLAKYNRDAQWTLKDVLFISHARPKTPEQDALWKRLINDELATPLTWEVELSAGKDKGKVFTDLLKEKKLGYLALLRNLRNMEQSNVPRDLVREALQRGNAEGILPYQFVAASLHAPSYAAELDSKMLDICNTLPKLSGRTIIIVDISGSMGASLFKRGTMSRMDAACALSVVFRESCDNVAVYATAGNDGRRKHATDIVAGYRGLGLTPAIKAKNKTLGGGGIFLKQVMDYIGEREKEVERVIIITDEQDCSARPEDRPSNAISLGKRNYIVNVGSYENGITNTRKGWINLTGFSENILQYIQIMENEE